jgi:hypothetical protein
MSYDFLDRTSPVITQTGTVFADKSRCNINACADAVLMGCLPGYAYSVISGSNDQPTVIHYTSGNDVLKLEISWGSSGGADGNPVQIVYKVSDNGGTDWVAIKTQIINYDANGNVSSTSWA